MPKLTMIIGLPGSGKSRYTNDHAKGLIRGFSDVMSPSGAQPSKVDDLILALRSGLDAIGDDVSWCEEERRNEFVKRVEVEVPGVGIEFVYFAASPEKCGVNLIMDFLKAVKPRLDLQIRADELRRLGGAYDVPPGVKPEPIWNDPGFLHRLLD